MTRFSTPVSLLTLALGSVVCATAVAADASCSVTSGAHRTPVVELYTSEGCSSCPPADQWASTLKGKPVVVEAFHVDYWDYIGWADRFASPANTSRQREIAAHNHLSSIYTPQVVRNGRDWRDWDNVTGANEPAGAQLTVRQVGENRFEAEVAPEGGPAAPWSAYWTVTENGHSSRVKAGENAGATLKHDFVVRQYTPVGNYQGTAKLDFNAIAADPAHPRQVNLVVYDPRSGAPLQALSLSCTG